MFNPSNSNKPNKQELKMTFAQDQIKGDFQPEHHSLTSVALVSVTMVSCALALLGLVA